MIVLTHIARHEELPGLPVPVRGIDTYVRRLYHSHTGRSFGANLALGMISVFHYTVS